jgi:pimeloyl-ACP methyl ester carboxylesterase
VTASGVTHTGFREGEIEVDGRRLRYTEAGQGPALVHLPGASGPRLTPAHELLAGQFRVLVFEPPAAEPWPDTDVASSVALATERLGLEAFDLLGSSASAAAALELALLAPHRVRALVLEAPLAIDPAHRDPELERRLSGLTTPTLTLFGTEDAVAPAGVGGVYKALIPGSHLVFVYAAGHAIAVDRPEAFAEVVLDFLERHEAFVISRTRSVILP